MTDLSDFKRIEHEPLVARLRAKNGRLRAAHGHLWFAVTNIVNDYDESDELLGSEVITELQELLTEHSKRFAFPEALPVAAGSD